MELPDEAIEFRYQDTLAPPPTAAFTPLYELQSKHLLQAHLLRALAPQLNQVRGQIAAEREMTNPPPELRPLEPGFINLPQALLDDFRRKKELSELGRVIRLANRLRENTDRVVILAGGAPAAGARALFKSLCHAHHNELPASARMGKPRVYFAGDGFDNDALAEVLELLEFYCVDPELQEERWGLVVVDAAGDTLETASAYRLLFSEAARYYGARSERLRQLVVPVSGPAARLRELCLAQGIAADDIPTVPTNVGPRYSVFTAAGLLPAAVMGLDARALLLGAAAMTKRFLEEPFERNPVLQYAAVNHLAADELGKPTRVLAVWSERLEAVGHWYEQLLAGSLGKQGRGPTPATAVMTRDLHARGQELYEGTRDKLVNNLVVRNPRSQPFSVGMADHNQDDLNQFSRRTLPDLAQAAAQSDARAYRDSARPAAEIVLRQVSEYTVGQLLQMLMLATVVEARLAGVNPYGQPAVDAVRAELTAVLQSTPNVPTA